ncbi:acetate/propionate kinase [Escherichia coli]|nr:acetate/propionate kinase [Escherichia coli]
MDGRLDAVVFTGGIGENAAMVRELSLGKLGVLGFEVDHERNLAARFGKSGFINKEGTRPAVVIPTNEETGYRARREPPDCLISHRQLSWRCCFVTRQIGGNERG